MPSASVGAQTALAVMNNSALLPKEQEPTFLLKALDDAIAAEPRRYQDL
jgi:hypothetical protein